MDFGKSFTYPFEDREWVTKILIGGILTMVPIVNLMVIGYTLKIIKNVADGVEHPLPNWDDFGDYFVKGLVTALASVVWALPIIIMVTVTAVLSTAIGYDTSSNTQQFHPFMVCVWGLSCLSGLYGLFLGLVLPAAYAKYALSGEFAAFFRFGEIFRFITANLGNYIIALVLTVIASFIAGFGVILCFVGVIFTQFWASLVGPHLLGQLCRLNAAAIAPTVSPEQTA